MESDKAQKRIKEAERRKLFLMDINDHKASKY